MHDPHFWRLFPLLFDIDHDYHDSNDATGGGEDVVVLVISAIPGIGDVASSMRRVLFLDRIPASTYRKYHIHKKSFSMELTQVYYTFFLGRIWATEAFQ